MKKVFCDFHHHDLFHSLRILFEKRLGWELYFPIGMEWAKERYWTYADNIPKTSEAVKRQYLEFGTQDGVDKTEKYMVRLDNRYKVLFKMLTLEQFWNTPIDIIICSVANHEAPYKKLADLHYNKPKLIRQVGNVNEIVDYNIIKNIMASAGLVNKAPDDVKVITYHQEFDLDIFHYGHPKNHKIIKSYLNCLPNTKDYSLYQDYKKRLGDYEWKMYGILGTDGIVAEVKDIAEGIREASFIYHVKHGGDGFGHCYSEDTEILTDKGWKYFKDLDKTEKVATLKNEGELVFEKPKQYIEKEYKGKLLHFKSRSIDLLVEPEHRMYIERYDKWAKSKGWQIEKAKDLNFMKPYSPRRAIGFKKAPNEWQGKNKIDIWWARFLGWYLSEGCCAKQKHKKGYETGHRILISNNNKQNLLEIVEIGKKLGYNPKIIKGKRGQSSFKSNNKYSYSVRICSKELYNRVKRFGLSADKFVPEEILKADRKTIKAFLDCYLKGDGSQETKDFNRATTVSKRLADDIQECAIKLGYKADIKRRRPSGIGKLPVFKIHISKWRNYVKCYKKPQEVDYNGKIYCVSVSSGIILVRRKGISVFSGNCIHNSFAIGRPVITRGQDYQILDGKLAGYLLKDNETCIDLDKGSIEENIKRIRHFSEPGEHQKMCQRVYKEFKTVVNFDNEFRELKSFLEILN